MRWKIFGGALNLYIHIDLLPRLVRSARQREMNVFGGSGYRAVAERAENRDKALPGPAQ